MDLSAIALQGLQQADAQLEAAVTKVASAVDPSADGAYVDTVSLSAAMVAMLSAKDQFSADASLVRTADELQKTTIDLMA
ncbi:MAG TPA: flagellar basal body rod C-terminal domain-containing protein [Terriglobales bacterium]|nr:flagellar basal body rod C-terminal domain-containing protein [Terriglobales bacterium]